MHNRQKVTSQIERSRDRMKKMIIAGMLTTIVIILSYTPLGYIPLPGVAATTIHIPVIVGTLTSGLGVGSAVGLMFGLTSFIRALSTGDIFFTNPLVSILPRLFIAPATWFAYIGIKKLLSTAPRFKNSNFRPISWGVSTIIGSMTNTILVLTSMYFVFSNDMLASALESNTTVWGLLITIFTVNGIPEAIVSTIISIAVMSALTAYFKRSKSKML